MGMEIKGTEMDSIEKYLELSRTCTEEESELYTRAITI